MKGKKGGGEEERKEGLKSMKQEKKEGKAVTVVKNCKK